MLTKIKSQYIQPGFEYKANWRAGKGENEPFSHNDPSLMYLKFVNGYERTYHMTASPMNFMKHDIDYIN